MPSPTRDRDNGYQHGRAKHGYGDRPAKKDPNRVWSTRRQGDGIVPMRQGGGRPGPRTKGHNARLQDCMWIAAAGHAIYRDPQPQRRLPDVFPAQGPTTNGRITFVSHCSQGPLLGKDPEFGEDPPPVMQTAHREASPAIFQRSTRQAGIHCAQGPTGAHTGQRPRENLRLFCVVST